MNTDKAYLLGLIIGGGIFGNAEDVFKIRLPYKNWGSYVVHPRRAGKIADDILRKVAQLFRAIYNISVGYEVGNGGVWTILCEGDYAPIIDDLSRYGIEAEGEIRTKASIKQVIPDLCDDNLKRRFIAGLADTIGSTSKSQRRFSAEHQIISFEINGFNFCFVCDLCKLLYSLNCIPDQVNWNHPNIHCSLDPYYGQWHKGFKLRVLLDQYEKFGAFMFGSKAISASENRKLQTNTHIEEECETRNIVVQPSCVHTAETDVRLPAIIREGHYIHFRHFCAVLGCPHAPRELLKPYFEKLGEYVIPFPILYKDTIGNVQDIISTTPLYARRKYLVSSVKLAYFLKQYRRNHAKLVYGKSSNTGYPIARILQAVAYIIASPTQLMGKRVLGNYEKRIEEYLNSYPDARVSIRRPEIFTPIIIEGNGRAAIVAACNPDVYEKLIVFDKSVPYKFSVREITEDDLSL